MTQYDYKTAEEWFKITGVKHPQLVPVHEAIIHALRIAQKLHEEPSDAAVWVAMQIQKEKHEFPSPRKLFKAMRDQMLKEISADDGGNE